MAYVVDGNIYVQIASNEPMQLTHNQGDIYPRFSDDGERLIFYRNPEPFTYHILDLYSIHIDGTQEKKLVTGSLLQSLGYNGFIEVESPVYVPGTHKVLFGTRQLSKEIPSELSSEGSKPNLDLLSVDIDTGEIKILLPPGTGGNFVVSPDGSMIAIQASGYINVVSMDGQMIRQNLVTYTPSEPSELIPGMFWTKDSTELLVTLPVDTQYEIRRDTCITDTGERAVWRYAIGGDARIQIPLDPPPIGGSDKYSISPDRNWILYPYAPMVDCGADEPAPPGLYLGNLHESIAQFYTSNADTLWSPDNIHFIYDIWEQGMFLGSVDELPVLIDSRAGSLGWIDAAHYLAYFSVDESATGMIGKINGETIYFPIGVPVSVLEDTARKLKLDFVYLDR